MRYGTIPLVGGRSRTSSPSDRRQNMGADASHGPVAIRLRLPGVILLDEDAVQAGPDETQRSRARRAGRRSGVDQSDGRDAATESTVEVAFADLLAHPDVVEEQ